MARLLGPPPHSLLSREARIEAQADSALVSNFLRTLLSNRKVISEFHEFMHSGNFVKGYLFRLFLLKNLFQHFTSWNPKIGERALYFSVTWTVIKELSSSFILSSIFKIACIPRHCIFNY